MKSILSIIVLACVLSAVHGRQLRQATSPSYSTVTDALTAAGTAPQLSTLVAAIKAAGLTIPSDAAWTIFAPTNEAFSDDDIREKTGLTAQQLLEPANKAALVQLLSFHAVPSGALLSSQLTEGQQLTTALAGASPLTVDLDDGKVEIEIQAGGDDDGDDADVEIADVRAGNSVIHVIDEVLIPASLRKGAAPASG